MTEPLKVGIISANWGTKAHLPAWRAVEGVEVVAICTAHEETARAAAAAHGIEKPYWDHRAMAADPDINIIDCGTRPDLREIMVADAIAAGKHVYNGIPFARDFAGGRRLRDLAADAGVVAAVDAFAQWIPAHRRMKEMIDEGFIGRPHVIEGVFDLSLFNRPSALFPWKWFADPTHGASALRNLGSHMLHMMVFLFGPIEEAIGWQEMFLPEWHFDDGQRIEPKVADTAGALLRFANGATGHLKLGWAVQGGEGWRIRATGSDGALVAAHPHFPTATGTGLVAERSTVRSWQGHQGSEKVDMPERLLRPDGIAFDAFDAPSQSFPMALLFQQMARAAAGGPAALPDFRQAWHVEQVLEAILRSTRSRHWEPGAIDPD